MLYISLNSQSSKVTFQKAVTLGLAPDKGLYFPEEIPTLPTDFFNSIENFSNTEIAFTVIKPYINNEIPDDELKKIVTDTLCFDFPLVEVGKNCYSLELFHGPTMAFKDVGARFMARCLAYFNKIESNSKNTILVATSGDTGGAVASGFLDVSGVDVVILYPTGKVSKVQEKQLTTLGKNITALEVDGVFDDCQDMVKKAFLDDDFKHLNLTSANSINIARWLPQMFYYFFAYKALKNKSEKLYFSVPSGNFGNICSGMLAKKMGLPIDGFIAATNSNDTVPRYMIDANYNPKASIATISNAMDVGNPSNFVRIIKIYQNNFSELQSDLQAISFSDTETKEAMKFIYKQHNYITEPHGAIGYLGIQNKLKQNDNSIGVFLETAHPIKFLETVKPTLNCSLEIPEAIKKILAKEKKSIKIESYKQLKSYLLSN
ncbi:threonine synthase [Flavobacterium sp. UBA6135]|uniref:threonine synthase n=1 Tax=Flavobacterium sp. UBA6135 TaxID=1946553 RepID=UPI0025C62B75|nr:threonine synthase [Flavobacterium sp. UBA6135]